MLPKRCVGVLLFSVATALASTAGMAATFACNGDCYGVSADAFAASASDMDSKAENNGVTSIAASAEYTVPGDEVYSGPNSAAGSASLATGSLHAVVDAFAGGAQSDASWFEQVSFSLPNGVSSVTIPFLWRIEGSNTVQTFKPSDSATSDQTLDAYFRIFAFENGHDSINLTVSCLTSGLCDQGPVSDPILGSITVEQNVLYEFDMGLSIFGDNIRKDFSHTAYLNLALPAGVVLNSSSGVFLSSPITTPGPVPESTTWAMMIVGFGLVGGTMRRRPAQARHPC